MLRREGEGGRTGGQGREEGGCQGGGEGDDYDNAQGGLRKPSSLLSCRAVEGMGGDYCNGGGYREE
jgi:hypothetical protein